MANESSVLVRLRLLGASAFSRDASQAGRGLGSIDRNARRATTGLLGVNKAAGKTAGIMRGIGGAVGVAGVAGGLGAGVGASVNFEQAMANVQARLLTTRSNMGLLSDMAIDLGGKTSFSANQAADAMGELAAAGFSTKQIMKMMPGTLDLAAASGSDLAFAAETSGALLRQFGLKAKDAGHLADVMTVAVNKSAIDMDDLSQTMKFVGPVAGRFNQSIEDIGASAALLGNVGIKGETAGTTLRRAFVNIVKPSKRTIEMLNGMGITTGEFAKATTDASGKLRPFPQMIGNLSTHIGKLSAPKQRKALAQLFGVEALPGMLTLMGKGEKGITSMSTTLEKSDGAAKKTAKIMRGTVKGAWDQFTGAMESGAIRASRGALPAVRKGLLGAADGIDKAVKFAPKLFPAFVKIGKGAGRVGGQLIDAFKPAMPFFENVLLPLLKGVAMGVIGGIVMAFKIAVPIIKVVATALGWLGEKLAPLKPVFQGVGAVIGFLFAGPILKLLGAVPKLGVVFNGLRIPLRFAGAAIKGVVGVMGKLIGVYVRAWTFVARFVGTFSSGSARVVRSAMNMVTGVVQKVGALPRKALRIASDFVSGLANGVRGRMGDLLGFFGRVGKSIVRAVVDAIKSAPGAIVGAITDIVPDKLKGAVKAVIPGLATGGTVRRGGLAVVGERGPELVKLPTASTVYDSRTSRRAGAAMAGGGTMMLTANLFLSGKQIHTEILRVDRELAEVA